MLWNIVSVFTYIERKFVVHLPQKISLRLEDNSNIFEAEWWALIKCLESCLHYYFLHPWSRLALFTDSQSNVKRWSSITSGKHQHVEKYLWELNRQLLEKGCEVLVQWIPSHSEIALNDRADTLANDATMLILFHFQTPLNL